VEWLLGLFAIFFVFVIVGHLLLRWSENLLTTPAGHAYLLAGVAAYFVAFVASVVTWSILG
jgi:hypothetical protein